nr:hypothetical protein [Tanacetum cinerariifolium]
MKKPHNLDSQANDTSLGKRVYRLEKKVKAMSKFNIQAATDESIEARLKQIELPKGGLDFKKSKLEKAFKQNVPKTSWNKSATVIYEQKSRLYKMIKEVKAFNNHPAHKAPYDALVVSLSIDEDDIDRIFDQAGTLKQGKSSSKSNKHVDADERVYRLEKKVKAVSKFNIQAATDESIEARLKQTELPKGGLDFKKSKLEKAFKQNVPKTSWNKSATAIYEQKSRLYIMIKEVKAFNNHPAHKAPYDALVVSLSIDEDDIDMIFGPEQNWFPEIEKTTKAPRYFDGVMGSTIDFLNFMKYILKKDTLTKANFEGPTNPEGDIIHQYSSKPLPLLTTHGHQDIPAKFFFNKDLEYLRSGNLEERKYTTSFTKTKATRNCFTEQDKKNSDHIIYSQMKILSIVRITMEVYSGYGYLKEIVVKGQIRRNIAIRPWSDMDKRWVESIVKVIKKTLHKRRIIRSLKCYVGGRKHEADYKLLTRTD